MIASNYIKHPEALRFQCEMFSNGYKNSPRIMRLMTVIFDWKLQAPQWVKDAMAKAKRLVKMCREQQMELFGKTEPNGAEVFIEKVPGRWKISLQINRNNAAELDRCGGLYRSLCRDHQNWASGNDFNLAYSNHSYEMDMGISKFA